MNKLTRIMHTSLLAVAAMTLMMMQSATISVYADDPVPCVPPPANTQAGVIRPVGADAAMYTYNCDTGLWENDHFTFNPNTGIVSAKDPLIYTYDASNGTYKYTTWVYNAPTRSYVPYTQSTATPPIGATVVGAPAPAQNTAPTLSNSGTNSNNTIDTNNGISGGAISNTGPGSHNQIGTNSGNTSTANNQTGAVLNNILNSNATSGDAAVLMNTIGGNAGTGNATVLANVVNLLQSSSSALGGDTATFVANINGDVNGDLMIDPNQLNSIQPATAQPTTQNNITLNNSANAAINNDVHLSAASGNAAVKNNTDAGNATTGSAQAIANVVNVINSAISGGKSFLGVININGNFNGDILVPPNFIDQLIASNVPTVSISMTGPSSQNSINNGQSGNNVTVTNTNNQGVTNTVNATATSGTATVTNNTNGGSATTGSAMTNITAFNLTGSSVIGNNALLVFVNVLGKWVGMIVNAPAGATAAELGGGITLASAGNNSADIQNTSNQQINNNITAQAVTGNATVDGNTQAGNATTGDAKTAINLLNVSNSSISLANWFGILFINVFGSWNGSFGVNTAAGDPPLTIPPTPASASPASSIPAAVRVFSFAPRTTAASVQSNQQLPVTNAPSVLAAHVAKIARQSSPQLKNGGRNLFLPLFAATLFILYIVAERIYSYQSRR